MFADIIVQDRDEHPVGLVEVKASLPSPETLQHGISQFDRSDPSISFGIFVDLENIHLLKRDAQTGAFTPIASLKTREVLRHYSPDFAGTDSRYGSIRVFEHYVETLVIAWLHDLADHWKLKTPPGTEEFAFSGLLEIIKGGFARRMETIMQPDQWFI